MAMSKVNQTLRAVGHGAFVGVTGDTTRLRAMRKLIESNGRKQRVTSTSTTQRSVSSKTAKGLREKFSSE